MTRARAAALAALAVGAVVVVLVVRGCGGGGPATAAAHFVPANALAYLHVSTDTGRPGTKDTLDLLRRLPSYATARTAVENALRRFGSGNGVMLDRDVKPWLGAEAAVALLPAGGATSGLFVLAVKDRPAVNTFLLRLGRPSALLRHHGVRVQVYGTQATALFAGHLVAGSLPEVTAAIDAHEDGPSLADSDAYRAAGTGASTGRWADFYAPAKGVRALAGNAGPLGGLLARALAPAGATGAFLTLGAKDGKGDVHVRVAGARLPLDGVTPGIAHDLPPSAVAGAEVGGLDRLLGRLIQGPLATLDQGVAQGGVDLRNDVLPFLHGDVGLAALPRGTTPALLLVARTHDEARARDVLARLQAPLVRLLTPVAGQAGSAPTFAERDVAGVQAFQLRVSSSFELDYAVWQGHLAVATSLGAIAAAHRLQGGLDESRTWQDVVRDVPGRVATVGFLDLGPLLDVLEVNGLDQDQQYLTVRKDVRRIRAAGFHATTDEDATTAEILLSIP